jgi:hypothetical protein
MAEAEPSGAAKRWIDRFGPLSRVAHRQLDGPRAILYPHDTEGREIWLNPIARLKKHAGEQRNKVSYGIYCVPRVIAEQNGDPIVVRRAEWASGADVDRCKKGNEPDERPSVVIAFAIVTQEFTRQLDELLFDLDKSLPSFPFQLEGLPAIHDAERAPRDPTVTGGTVTPSAVNELSRTYYDQEIRLSWHSSPVRRSQFEMRWRELYDALSDFVVAAERGKPEFLERYDP